MSHIGDCLDSNGLLVKNKTLLFWGEYECRSSYSIIAKYSLKNYYNNPVAVHTPLYPNALTKGLNTDPFIFGDKFYYHCCKIGKIEGLLKKGDIVLFGTVFKSGPNDGFEFHLDTLIVIGEKIDNDKGDSPFISELFDRCNPEVRNAWEGLMYSQNRDLFSFVPCKDYVPGNGFGRPTIDVKSLGFPPITSCRYNPALVSYNDNSTSIFNKIKEMVTNQGFCLGIRFDQPVTTDPCEM